MWDALSDSEESEGPAEDETVSDSVPNLSDKHGTTSGEQRVPNERNQIQIDAAIDGSL